MAYSNNPNLPRVRMEAVRELERAHQLRKTAVRASKAGIRAVKERKARDVAHEKARIQQCMQEIRDLSLVPVFRRSEFIDQVAAELVELVHFELTYPYVFFGDTLGSPELLSAERLEVSPQARYHGIADVPGELGKAVTRFRRGRPSREEKIAIRERLLQVVQDIISYLADAVDENVLEITGHEKDFRFYKKLVIFKLEVLGIRISHRNFHAGHKQG